MKAILQLLVAALFFAQAAKADVVDASVGASVIPYSDTLVHAHKEHYRFTGVGAEAAILVPTQTQNTWMGLFSDAEVLKNSYTTGGAYETMMIRDVGLYWGLVAPKTGGGIVLGLGYSQAELKQTKPATEDDHYTGFVGKMALTLPFSEHIFVRLTGEYHSFIAGKSSIDPTEKLLSFDQTNAPIALGLFWHL